MIKNYKESDILIIYQIKADDNRLRKINLHFNSL